MGDGAAMSEQLAVLQEVVRRLERAGLPYMVTGSMAVNYYGQPRMTRDIDIVLQVDLREAETVYGLFAGDFYVDRGAILEAVTRGSMFNIIHNTYVVKVDFIVRKGEPYRIEEFKRRRVVMIDDVEVAMVAPEDLVLSKLAWAKESRSEMHLGDVVSVLKSGMQLDYAYLEHWAKVLSVMELYHEVLR